MPKVTEDYSLAKVYPDVAKLWDYDENGELTPETISPRSGKHVHLIKECNTSLGKRIHKWTITLSNAAVNNGACPYCSKNHTILLVGFNDLKTLNPEIAKEWDYEANGGLRPEDVLLRSNKKVWWVKSCDPNHKYGIHKWLATPAMRFMGTSCPTCAGKKVTIGFNDLVTLHPEIAKEWHPTKNKISLYEITESSDKCVWWFREECGHEWESQIKSRTIRNGGCVYCSGQQVLSGFNDFATRKPDMVHMWSKNNKISPKEVVAYTKQKVLWVCELGHEWDATVAQISGGGKCPYCSSHRVLAGFNDLATHFPEIALEWNYSKNSGKPSEFAKSANKKVWWKCTEGHEWQATINARTSQKVSCGVCTNKKLLKGTNDFATTHPELASEWSPKNAIKPDEVIAGNMKYFIWECTEGHEWEQCIGARKRGNGCPKCNVKTSRPEKLLRESFKPLLKTMNVDHTEYIKISDNMRAKQVDVFGETFEGEKIIVEYDGWYWHKDKLEKDFLITNTILENGYKIIRIRESSGSRVLAQLDIKHANLLQIPYKFISTSEEADAVAKQIMDWVGNV